MIELTVVTASGDLITFNSYQNTDLFGMFLIENRYDPKGLFLVANGSDDWDEA